MLAVAVVAGLPAALRAGDAPGFAASFVLAEGDAKQTSTSTGSLALAVSGEAYVDVQTPVDQKIWMNATGMSVYYPAEGTVIKTSTAQGELPPVFDALLAAVRDPADLLGGKAKLKDRGREGERLVTRWQAADKDGKALGTVKVTETAEAVQRLEVFGPKGGLAVRYDFAGHRKSGGLRVPATIEARYFTAKGAEHRFERWRLSDARPLDAATRDLLGGPPPFPNGTVVKMLKKR